MKQNMGTLDKILRLVVAIVVAILYFTGTISGQIVLGLGVLAAIFVLTSLVGFCPLYLPFGLDTKEKK
ncbi:MAG: DUF2892 domain-containing protein [Bacteroidia bacterium]|nr:DUF2892 domain-containing protein [Bacteroidia bacterium]